MNLFRRTLVSVIIMVFFTLLFQLLRVGTMLSTRNITNEIEPFILSSIISSENTENTEKVEDIDYLIIYDSGDATCMKAFYNIKELLNFHKKAYKVEDVNSTVTSLNQYKTVIYAVSDWDGIGNIIDIPDYVNSGGNVFFAVTPKLCGVFYSISPILGIYESGLVGVKEGIVLHSNLLLGAGRKEFDDKKLLNSSVTLRLTEENIVHISSRDRTPILWQVNYGNGIFMVCNGEILAYKSGRGVFAGVLATFEQDYLYPIINAKIFFISNFPGSFSQAEAMKKVKIGKDNKTDFKSFVRETWLPNMLSVAQNNRIKYTTAFIQNFSSVTSAPFPMEGLSKNLFVICSTRIIKYGGEIAFHGYNSNPLGLKGSFGEAWYKPWGSNADMEKSINAAVMYAKEALPMYTLRCYCPPYSTLSEGGRSAVKAMSPGITSISGAYEPIDEYSLSQEFTTRADGIVDVPKISSGYIPQPYEMWKLINAVNSIGVISHEMNFSDIVSGDKQVIDWVHLMSGYNEFTSSLSKQYGFVSSYTASQAAEEIKRFDALKTHIVRENDTITVTCEDFSEKAFFILRTSKKVQIVSGASSMPIANAAYLIEANKSLVIIKLVE